MVKGLPKVTEIGATEKALIVGGVASVEGGCVVTQNCPCTPPMVSVAQLCVLKLPAEVSRTVTVLPLFTVPDAVVYAAPFTL